MIAAELLRGVRVSRTPVAVAYVAGALVVASNVYVLRDAEIAYRNTSDLITADLGALQIARDRIAAPIALDESTAGTAYVPVTSSAFFSAADDYGSPADSAAEIASAPEPARVAADRVPAGGRSSRCRPDGRCAHPRRTAPRSRGSSPSAHPDAPRSAAGSRTRIDRRWLSG